MTTAVYLDESGDLGFDFAKPRTSRFFVVAALVCSDPKPVAKVVRRTLAGFSKTQMKRHRGSLHAFQENERTIRRVLAELSELQVRVAALCLDKHMVPSAAGRDTHALYNSLVERLLNRVISAQGASESQEVLLVASRRETNASLNERFVSHLAETVAVISGAHLEIRFARADIDKALQAADTVSWSFFQWCEHGDSSYVDTIRRLMLEDEARNG
ncbi:MAG: DUF3800 domain-containing protein [Bifidobacteriaceae bacterium]|jgi:hypothetical protein|nr:DUF3800 domain-containing protein [Bifidobacteriaceae bacterium]